MIDKLFDIIYGEHYYCYFCGAEMEKVDEEVVVCPKCGHSVNIEDYVTEGEDYEEYYDECDDELKWRFDADFPEEFPGESEYNEDGEDDSE